jgi:hypothetical protein
MARKVGRNQPRRSGLDSARTDEGGQGASLPAFSTLLIKRETKFAPRLWLVHKCEDVILARVMVAGRWFLVGSKIGSPCRNIVDGQGLEAVQVGGADAR